MTAHRREGDGETADSATRMWRVYADEIGLPDPRPAERTEPLPRLDALSAQRPARSRRIVERGGGVLLAVAVVLVVAIVGSALWSSPPTFVRTPDTRATTPVAQPSRDIVRTAEISTPHRDAAETRPTAGSSVAVSTDAGSASRESRPAEAAVAPPTIGASSAAAVQKPDAVDERTVRRSAAVTPERSRFAPPISFDFGSERLDAQSMRALDNLVLSMKANPDWRLAIEGHTDSHGPPEYNQALSERRAEAVKTHLESAGIAPHRLRAVGFGAARPIVPNDGQRDFLNRRVELNRR